MRRKRSLGAIAVAVVALLAGAVTIAVASAPTNVTPTLLARGTYDSFKVASMQGPGMFKAEAK